MMNFFELVGIIFTSVSLLVVSIVCFILIYQLIKNLLTSKSLGKSKMTTNVVSRNPATAFDREVEEMQKIIDFLETKQSESARHTT